MASADLDGFLADVGASQYGWPESLRFTYDKTLELLARDVPGDLVECGVGNGCHPAAMWRATHDADQPRIIRLFDSFQGVPNGGPHDVEWNREHGDGSGRLEYTGVADASLPLVQANLMRWGCDLRGFAFHPGWFQHTLPLFVTGEPVPPIAFLRIDGDLYESTLICLRHLYPLVSPGGVIVVDDWNLDGCRKAVERYFLAQGNGVMLDVSLPDFPDGIPAALPAYERITESGDVWWTKP